MHNTPNGADIAEALASFTAAPTALRLECGVQHYPWGDHRFIPSLIDVANPRDLPFAELWIGAHPDLLATVQLQGWRLSLAELIAAAPEVMLGPRIAATFGHALPFLLKVLAAREPLSIQAHPTRAQAMAGFEHENAIGLPLNAAHRSYRDPNHKPELLVALTDFTALRGFRPLRAIEATLRSTPELAPLHQRFSPTQEGLLSLYRWLMARPQAEVNALLQPLLTRYRHERDAQAFDPSDRRDWMLEAARLFSLNDQRDRGLFSLLLLNLVTLQPGEALFLPAGELHAYLRGAGIEVMANSNNVLRGGLTQKYIDLPGLLNALRIHPGPADILQPLPQPCGPETYATPAREFLLERYRLAPGEQVLIAAGDSLRLGIVLDGQLSLYSDRSADGLGLERGATFVLPAACQGRLRSHQRSLVFTALTPEPAPRPPDAQARPSPSPTSKQGS